MSERQPQLDKSRQDAELIDRIKTALDNHDMQLEERGSIFNGLLKSWVAREHPGDDAPLPNQVDYIRRLARIFLYCGFISKADQILADLVRDLQQTGHPEFIPACQADRNEVKGMGPILKDIESLDLGELHPRIVQNRTKL